MSAPEREHTEGAGFAAYVFDAYGTLFDVHSAVRRHQQALGAHHQAFSDLWRTKQLEYTWQRSAMGRWAPFETVTREALVYAIGTVKGVVDERIVEALCPAFDRLSPFPDAKEALAALAGARLAVLSNGSEAMLEQIVRHTRKLVDVLDVNALSLVGERQIMRLAVGES